MNVKDDVSTNWKLFEQAWQYYVTATELNKKSKEVQAGALCSVMGLECVKVMNSLTTLTVEDKSDPAKILTALGNHFMPQKHLLFERVKFGFANQTEHETIDQYVVRLRQLAESCEFEGLCESLIRDRLVIGTQDSATRDRLLRERPVPGLTRCIEALRASELSRKHKEQLKDAVSDPQNTVHAADKQSPVNRKQSRRTRGSESKQSKQEKGSAKKCKFCGTNHPYDRAKCPASGKTCLKCGKLGHFAVKCQEKNRVSSAPANKVHHTSATPKYAEGGESACESASDSDESIFVTERVGVVSSNVGKSSFMVPLTFHTEYSPTITTQLDTGATCSAMSYTDLLNILQSGDVKLKPPGGKIRLYDGRVVEPLGSYTFTVSLNSGSKCEISFDILENAPWPIIDGNTCAKQGWISLGSEQFIHSLNSENYEPLSFDKLMRDYEDVFTGLGCLPGEYHIEIDPDIRPVQHIPRRVPVPLKAKLKEKIDEMEKQGIIIHETKPTDWISSLVAVQKPGKLRVCIDPRDLNRAIKRPKYQMPTVDEVLPKLAKAKVFTVLDAKDGFYQVKLDNASSLLTTFWTPFGRYRYLRMPQGISSAPEEYQRRQNEALAGLNGVEVIADDILCYGSGENIEDALKDHDSNLLNLLDRARSINLKLNKKLRLRLDQVTYMGHSFTSEGLRPDPMKVEAIASMPRPDDKKAVQRLLGCVNYLSRFMPTISEVSEPLRKLTEKNAMFVWESQQEEAFQAIKNMISSTPVLKYYDVGSETTIQCDASESGLGATLLQNGQPVAFASRSLSVVERRYAQIEKECLAIVFACSRFNQYLHGRESTTVETDHKPLVPIFQKSLHSAPKRLQRMLLRLQKYNLYVKYLPGSQMYIADMLSRAYLQADHSQHGNIPEYQIFQLSQEQLLFQEIADINQVDYMRLSEGTHQQIQQCTVADAALQSLMNMIMVGWPLTKEEVPVCIREYWNYKEELTVQDGVLYKGMKVIVPASMRPQMIARAHSSHLGPDACVRRARDVLFWPGMADQIKDQVQNCEVCNDFLARQQKEPLMTHKIPETPWSKVGQDLFTLGDENYLVTVDYYSDYFEVDLLPDTTAESVVNATKRHFARHGIADMVTDNGPQYSSSHFAKFSHEWEFQHTTSSPLHSQSNGKAESAVKIAKNLVKKAKRGNKDLQMSLLEWRNTPDSNGLSPVQKLMSRRTRTTIPTTEALLKPEVIDGVRDNIKRKRQQAKAAYDKHAKPLPELQVGEPVRLQPVNPKTPWEKGSCVAKVGPRSYLIETESGNLYRRNRKFIRQDPSQERASSDNSGTNPSSETSPDAGSPTKSLPDTKVDSSVKQAPAVREMHEKSTAVEEIVTLQPQQTVVTRSGRTSVCPSRFEDFVT